MRWETAGEPSTEIIIISIMYVCRLEISNLTELGINSRWMITANRYYKVLALSYLLPWSISFRLVGIDGGLLIGTLHGLSSSNRWSLYPVWVASELWWSWIKPETVIGKILHGVRRFVRVWILFFKLLLNFFQHRLSSLKYGLFNYLMRIEHWPTWTPRLH